MFYLRITGVSGLILTMMLPKPAPPYNATSGIPIVNKACLNLSAQRRSLPRDELNDYMCFCIKADFETKKFFENTFETIISLKNVNSTSITLLSETFTDIAKYLEVEFEKQNQTIENRGTTSSNDSPLSKFVIDNVQQPDLVFCIRYALFLVNHIFARYRNEFEKLKFLNIPKLLRSELDLIYCDSEYFINNGYFNDVSVAVKKINSRTLEFIKSMVKSTL